MNRKYRRDASSHPPPPHTLYTTLKVSHCTIAHCYRLRLKANVPPWDTEYTVRTMYIEKTTVVCIKLPSRPWPCRDLQVGLITPSTAHNLCLSSLGHLVTSYWNRHCSVQLWEDRVAVRLVRFAYNRELSIHTEISTGAGVSFLLITSTQSIIVCVWFFLYTPCGTII